MVPVVLSSLLVCRQQIGLRAKWPENFNSLELWFLETFTPANFYSSSSFCGGKVRAFAISQEKISAGSHLELESSMLSFIKLRHHCMAVAGIRLHTVTTQPGLAVVWHSSCHLNAGWYCCGDVAVCLSVCHVDVLCPDNRVDHAIFMRL